jgi:hypothetical protein
MSDHNKKPDERFNVTPEYEWVKDNDKWKDYINHDRQEPWTSLEDLTVRELRQIREMISHNVNVNEMHQIVVKITEQFGVSPHTSFNLWQHKCKLDLD